MRRVEARAAILLTVLFLIAVGLVRVGQWTAFAALWLGLACVAGRSLGRLSRKALSITPFALAALPLLFTVPGETWMTLGAWKITQPGARQVATLLLRAYLDLQASLLLLETLGAPALLTGLAGLGVPAVLVGVISMMVRYTGVLRDELDRMVRARESRSAGRIRPAWHWRARMTGMMAGNLFLRALDRGDRVHQAMRCRGYDGRPFPSQRSAKTWTWREWGGLTFGTVYLAVCLTIS